MKTVKMKTSELTGPALDWATAKAINAGAIVHQKDDNAFWLGYHNFSPSTRWRDGGPLIELYEVDLSGQLNGDKIYMARCRAIGDVWFGGKHPLIAVCRAIVSAKLGGKVEVPEDLCTH